MKILLLILLLPCITNAQIIPVIKLYVDAVTSDKSMESSGYDIHISTKDGKIKARFNSATDDYNNGDLIVYKKGLFYKGQYSINYTALYFERGNLPMIENKSIKINRLPDTLEIPDPDPSWATLVSNGYDMVPSVEIQKYETIGPVLRLVSDTAHDHWNGVSAMWVYEVRVYEKVSFALNLRTNEQETIWGHPKTFKWLDSKKKPLSLKVWEDTAHDNVIYLRGGGVGLFDIYDRTHNIHFENNSFILGSRKYSLELKEFNHDNPYQ
jgi:hypothetical protein